MTRKRRASARVILYCILPLALVAMLGTFLWRGYANATLDPIIRRAEIGLPVSEESVDVRILLISDLHVKTPDMAPERLSRIFAALNRLHPDIVLIAGDFVGGTPLRAGYSAQSIAAPLAGLRAPSGVFAVLGNHDRAGADKGDKLALALRRVGVRVLEDEGVRAGGVSIGGVGRSWSKMMKSLARLPPPRIILMHSPSSVRRLKTPVALVAAGHTHCGQVVLPLLGAPWIDDDVPRWAACGLTVTSRGVVVVTGGLGTSHLPLRFNAPADAWLIRLRGAQRSSPSRAVAHANKLSVIP